MQTVTWPGLFIGNSIVGGIVTAIFTSKLRQNVIDGITTDKQKEEHGAYLKSRENSIAFHRYGLLAGSYTLSCLFMAYQPDSKLKSLYAVSWIVNYALSAHDIYNTTWKSEWSLCVFNVVMVGLFTFYLKKVGFTFNDLKTFYQ